MPAIRFPVSAMAMIAFALSLVSCSQGPNARAIAEYIEAASSYDAGDLSGALAGAEKALAIDSSFRPALMLAGKAYYFLGDDIASVSSLERALKLAPRAGEAALWLSRAYRAAGKDAEAKGACESLLSSDSSNIAALRLASAIAIDSGDAAVAAAYLDRAVEAAAEAGLAFTDRAALRWASGDRDGTLFDLDAALSILPADSAAREAAAELRVLVMESKK